MYPFITGQSSLADDTMARLVNSTPPDLLESEPPAWMIRTSVSLVRWDLSTAGNAALTLLRAAGLVHGCPVAHRGIPHLWLPEVEKAAEYFGVMLHPAAALAKSRIRHAWAEGLLTVDDITAMGRVLQQVPYPWEHPAVPAAILRELEEDLWEVLGSRALAASLYAERYFE